MYTIVGIIQELLRGCPTDQAFLALNLKSILFNLTSGAAQWPMRWPWLLHWIKSTLTYTFRPTEAPSLLYICVHRLCHFFDHQILYLLRVQCICLCFFYIKLVLFNLSSAYIHTLIVYTYGTCIYVIYTARYNSTTPVSKNKIFDARFQPQKALVVLLINNKTNYYYIH